MLDVYVPEPFDGGSRFKKFCKTVDEPKAPLPRYGTPVETIVPRSGLFDIYKRTTDLSENKCIAIGFTYADATEFVKKRLKTRWDTETVVVTFYDIIPQDNEAAINPLWNPPQITIEEN